jgi:circadian clock protein KaiC
LSTGVAGLDQLLAGGVFERSVTLLSGSAGIGKSTFAMQFIAEGIRQKEPALFVAFEEAPQQILEGAEGLGLPLAAASNEGLLEIVYLTRDSVRANQMLAILADRIRAREVKRLVLDGASHMLTEAMADSDQRQLLYGLITRFKRMGVTSLVTLESSAMYSTDNITDHGFSPLGDNLLALRYIKMPGEIRPSLTIVKTRGSAHDFGTYFLEFSNSGLRVGGQVEAPRRPSSS